MSYLRAFNPFKLTMRVSQPRKPRQVYGNLTSQQCSRIRRVLRDAPPDRMGIEIGNMARQYGVPRSTIGRVWTDRPRKEQ